jgi:hypothetical protein
MLGTTPVTTILVTLCRILPAAPPLSGRSPTALIPPRTRGAVPVESGQFPADVRSPAAGAVHRTGGGSVRARRCRRAVRQGHHLPTREPCVPLATSELDDSVNQNGAARIKQVHPLQVRIACMLGPNRCLAATSVIRASWPTECVHGIPPHNAPHTLPTAATRGRGTACRGMPGQGGSHLPEPARRPSITATVQRRQGQDRDG